MDLSNAVHALRLNQSFPDATAFADHLALAAELPHDVDPHTALPPARAWSRIRAEADTAAERRAALADRRDASLPEAARAQLEARLTWLDRLLAARLLPARRVEVQLRHRDGPRATYQVRIDRQSLTTGLPSRYTLVVSDIPGPRIPEGELALQAREAFEDRLELLGTQDAALTFAALEAEGVEVHEVVRGTIGPAADGAAGGRWFPTRHPTLSAVLERASRDLDRVQVDDPLPHSVTLPRADAGFGLVAARKWAVARSDLEATRAWVDRRGKRALLYPYDPDPDRMQ